MQKNESSVLLSPICLWSCSFRGGRGRMSGIMLAPVVGESAGYVTKAVIKASKKRAGAVGGSFREAAVKSAGKMKDSSKKSARTAFNFFKKPKK